MSREVRRVPIDYKHPTTHNPYWDRQRRPAPSRLHGPTERFVGLMGDFPGRLARWEEETAELARREGHDWKFSVEYHLTGFQGQDDDEPVVHPFHVWVDGTRTVPVVVRDEDHLHALMTTEKAGGKPGPVDYMPVFNVPPEELGWCLYETVSEGTPATPVFATAEELIEHLATVGQDWDQVPLRRASAEAIVRQGGTLGSFLTMGGVLLDSTRDADVIASPGGKS